MLQAAAAEVAKHCPGGIDVLINNAGITGDMGPARDE
jgi:NAD(P)-dependent dehydrogenase (short-subunit alcohol dehydrogenase family)